MGELDWEQVVAAAVRAPSIHNTQPWAFLAHGDRLEVFVDRERALPVLDPTGRQQVVSCGVAVEFALVALRAGGHAAEADLLPERPDADHLARIRVTGGAEPTVEGRDLAEAIGRRHTVRAAFDPRAVPDELVGRLQDVAGDFGVWLKPITREEEEVATAFLVSQAEEIERGAPDYLTELQHWVRTDPDAVDGVPVATLPSDDPATRPSNWLIRDFIAGQHAEHRFLPPGDPSASPPVVERPAVVLLGTENDDRRAWLDAGRALARLLLHATTAGLVASPLTQALDWPSTRTQLRGRLSLVGHPQMLLRMGYPSAAEAAGAASGRRPVGEVLRVEPAGG